MTEFSYGILPLKKDEKGWQALLIQHNAGHWAFPKGHANPGETERETAERELEEETNLKIVRYVLDEPLEEHYMLERDGKQIKKTVYYFAAEVQGTLKLQEAEVQSAEWLRFRDVGVRLSFGEIRSLFVKFQRQFLT
jgi:bis(5'-nucleosidyl)-tetraphosphatase